MFFWINNDQQNTLTWLKNFILNFYDEKKNISKVIWIFML